MITCESLYEALLSSLRKEKRSWSISPDDANESIFQMANKTIWEKYSALFEEDQDNSNIMGIFKVFSKELPLEYEEKEGGTILTDMVRLRTILPEDYDRLIGLPFIFILEDSELEIYLRPVDVVTSNEFTFRMFDYLTRPTKTRPICELGGKPNRKIYSVSDYSATVAGTIKITSDYHALSTGHVIIISGTANYNGVYTVTKIDPDNFYITAVYVSSQTGTWTTRSAMEMKVAPVDIMSFDKITSIYLHYLRSPATPFLDYYMNNTTLELTFLSENATHVNVPSGCTYRTGTVGGAAVYVDSATVNFEWEDSLFNELLAVMQQTAAIQLQDTSLIANNEA